MLGRGKDNTMAFAGSVKDAVTSVLSSIQNSVPVSAVDVAYDQATDALAGLSGGQRGKVMQAIKGYRNLVKEYPKTAGFAKAALVAIAGLATGGAGLPAIAGLTYALDSAIRGDKLSSVLGKGVGAAAVTWGGQQVAGALKGTTPAVDSSVPAADSLGPGETIPGTGSEGGKLLSWSQGVGPGDTLSSLAKQYNVSVDELLKANPQITNPDVLQVGSSIQIPTNNFQGDQWGSGLPTYDKGVGTSADTMAKIKTGQYTDSPISQALAKKVRESVKFKMLPAEKLIDRQGTIMSWALQESIGVKRKSVNLTTTGAYTVFENIDRYRQAIMEKAGVPGSTRPAYYRPDMSGGPGKKSKPGIVGRGLNWLDRTAGKVGGALSNFGHQFTTNVTKEKLKMNWHQAGKPSDSDQLAAFLTKQGVPQEVVATVYGKMSIPYIAPVVEPKAQPATDPAATGKSGIQTGATALIDPDTKRPYEKDKLAAMYGYKEPAAPTPELTPDASSPYGKGDPEKTKVTVTKLSNDQLQSFISKGDPANPHVQIAKAELAKRQASGAAGATGTAPAVTSNPAGFNAGNVMKLPGMEKYAKPAAPAKTANFAGPSGYGKITTSFKPPAAPSSPALAVPKAPAAPKVTAGGPTPAEKANLDKRIAAASAAAPAVAETLRQIDRMLESVTSKKSAEIIKAYADQQFTELGLRNTTECKQIMAHVVHESAVRRRAYAQRMAK
jgi:LysM repeat protein